MIDTLLELQKPIMLFFQSIRVPVGDFIAKAITYCGDAPVAILVLLIIYWCVDKRTGFAFGGTLLPANFSMNIFKVIFRVPRPWVQYPDELECALPSTATGYSFPSGHSTTSGALWGTAYKFSRKQWLKVLSIILIILVPISRVYLTCHWPLDVIVGTALGLLFSLFLSKKMYALYDDEKRFGKVSVIIATITGAVGLVTAILLEGGAIEALLWKDLMETAIMCSGLFLGAFLERNRVNFKVPSTMKKKIVGFIIGAVLGIGLWQGIKAIPIFPMIFKCASYFFLAFWSSFVYPMIAIKLNIFEKENA
ncbi:MAG: phosphatase PAP2 family protein [Spirochaetales bacterium]|nr:phosphatase PAP2 family protein [Spirochaetales bacterium]